MLYRKKTKRKVIEFFPQQEVFEAMQTQPQNATKTIPNWYKEMPIYIDQNIKEHIRPNFLGNITAKTCTPFLDSLTLGYMICLSSDLLVSKKQEYQFNWEVTWKVVSEHQKEQISTMPIHEEYSTFPFKFEGTHCIKTPPGYSLLFTHPLNRYDLPFLSFSGVVDTDKYNSLAINIPFLIRNDFEGIIEKGTPIAQIIPIKREEWSSTTHKYDKNNLTIKYGQDYIKSTLFRSYKNRFWTKKTYH